MKFIPKKSLEEGMAANPLDHNIKNDKDITKLAQEAILTAMAAETDAINQYTQILDMVFISENWLKDLVTEPLTDIINEEKKHLAQISNLVSHFPNFSEKWNEGWKEAISGEDESNEENNPEEDKVKEEKESVTESIDEAVAKDRTYNIYDICQLLANTYELSDEQYWEIEDLFNKHALEDDELSPEETDLAIHEFAEKYELTPEEVKALETKIMTTVGNPQKDRVDDFKDDVESDIDYLNNLLEDEKIATVAAKQKIYQVIQYLKDMEYNGDKDTGWRSEHSLTGAHPKRKMIS